MDVRAGWRSVLATVTALAVTSLAGCGGETSTPSTAPSTRAGGSQEALASRLVLPEDLGTGWTIRTDPSAGSSASPGVVTADMQALLPRMEFCAQAGTASQETARNIQWQAFRQLDLDTGESPSPTPQPGSPPSHHLVFVQEFLLESPSVGAMYDALAAGMVACIGVRTAYPDGEVGASQATTAPPVGDARTATRDLIREPGGRDSAVWDITSVLARDGDVLLLVTVAEISTPEVRPVLDKTAENRIISAAAGKLA